VSVCSGVGGLDLGIDLALGGRLRPILYVEREGFAAANLVKAMGEGAMDEAPVWSDLTTICEGEVADGMACRVDRLRACGNGVVPLTAAFAFVCLYADLAGEDDREAFGDGRKVNA